MAFERNLVMPSLHAGQAAVLNACKGSRFNIVSLGRRSGKTNLAKWMILDELLKDRPVAVITPNSKQSGETFFELATLLEPLDPRTNAVKGVIRVPAIGKDARVDFWSCEAGISIGRSRRYSLIILDEIAHVGDSFNQTWELALQPTMLDYAPDSRVFGFSTPNGIADENWFYAKSQDKEWCFVQASTFCNPFVPHAELKRIKETVHPMTWAQEWEGKFIDWNTNSVFHVKDLLGSDGEPVKPPFPFIGQVHAIVDSGMKGGSDHDMTAILYVGVLDYQKEGQAKIYLLDWEVSEITGLTLVESVPRIVSKLETFAKDMKAVYGVGGCYVEGAQAGIVLLQKARQLGYNFTEIDGTLMNMGKDNRAMAMADAVSAGKIKISPEAYYKTMTAHGVTKNHLLSQIQQFRLASKDAYKREDDALDTFIYSGLLFANDGATR